jgi:hypothetical protein
VLYILPIFTSCLALLFTFSLLGRAAVIYVSFGVLKIGLLVSVIYSAVFLFRKHQPVRYFLVETFLLFVDWIITTGFTLAFAGFFTWDILGYGNYDWYTVYYLDYMLMFLIFACVEFALVLMGAVVLFKTAAELQ